MKKYFILCLLILLVCSEISAQRIWNAMNQRNIWQEQADDLTDSKKEHLFLDKSGTEQWNLKAKGIIVESHRVYSVKMVDENIIWMVSTYDAFPPPENANPYIIKSLDGGTTWEQYKLPNTRGHYAFDIAPIDENTAYVVINDEDFRDDVYEDFIYKTTDGGSSWEIVDSYPHSPSFIHFFDQENGWVLGAENSNGFSVMSVTADGGATWNHAGGEDWVIPEGRNLPDLDSTAFIGTWAFSVNSNYEIVDSSIIIGGSKRYWISHDMGYNWQSFESPLFEDNRITTVVAMKDTTTLMLASNVDTLNNLAYNIAYTTTNGGETWTKSFPQTHLSAIHYLPNTENSFIAIGHANFGVGNYGTSRTDNLTGWRLVDDTRLLAMDLYGELGTAVLGYIPPWDELGDIYNWGDILDYDANIIKVYKPNYLINTPRNFTEDVIFDYEIQNKGRLELSNISVYQLVLKEGNIVYENTLSIEEPIQAATASSISFAYTPTEIGKYDYIISMNQAELGDFFEDVLTFELSATTMARDDGTPEQLYGFGYGDPSWYGYYGSEFQLAQSDTLESITVFIRSEESIRLDEAENTFNFSLTSFDELGQPNAIPFFKSAPLAVADDVEFVYTYELPEPIVVPSRFILAAGQDSLQGIVGFGFDEDNNNEGYWITSPVAGGGYPWVNDPFDVGIAPTLMIRPHFTAAETITSTQDFQASTWDVQVYPTVFRDHFTININHPTYQNLKLQLFDNNGKLLLDRKITNQISLIEDLKNLPKGMYMLRLVTQGFQYATKVLKQ